MKAKETSDGFPKLERQPLTLVLAEFRFGRIELDGNPEGLAALKEKLSSSFAEVQEQTNQRVHVGDRGVNVTIEKAYFWRDLDGMRFAQLEPERIWFATTRYPRFPSFHEQCMGILSALHGTLTPSRIMRIGLRYNDAVVPHQGDVLEDYLLPPLMPLESLAKDGDTFVRHLMETSIGTRIGQLVVRSMVGCHGLSVMPDLVPHFGALVDVKAPASSPTAVLDFDHVWSARGDGGEPFDVESIGNLLAELHKPARQAFWSSTTEFARAKRWN